MLNVVLGVLCIVQSAFRRYIQYTKAIPFDRPGHTLVVRRSTPPCSGTCYRYWSLYELRLSHRMARRIVRRRR